jgi:hypothetical protein
VTERHENDGEGFDIGVRYYIDKPEAFESLVVEPQQLPGTMKTIEVGVGIPQVHLEGVKIPKIDHDAQQNLTPFRTSPIRSPV